MFERPVSREQFDTGSLRLGCQHGEGGESTGSLTRPPTVTRNGGPAGPDHIVRNHVRVRRNLQRKGWSHGQGPLRQVKEETIR